MFLTIIKTRVTYKMSVPIILPPVLAIAFLTLMFAAILTDIKTFVTVKLVAITMFLMIHAKLRLLM